MSWRGKALCHLRTGCPIEGDIFMLFPSTKGNLRLFFSWSQVKTLLASPPIMPQVCRGDRKAIGFSQCCLHAFQENKTNHIQIQLLVCLSSSSILLEPETLPKPWTRKEGRGFGRLPGWVQKNWLDRFSFLTFSVGLSLPSSLQNFWVSTMCTRLCADPSPCSCLFFPN